MFHPMAADGAAGRYLDWGVVHISVANALIILLMVVVFVAALLVPFPGPEEPQSSRPISGGEQEVDR